MWIQSNTQHHSTHKKANLFREIFTQQIQRVKYSYSIVSKTSESGVYQNERIILLNHQSCLGYASIPDHVQQLPYMKKQKLPKLKCSVKLSEIIKVENTKKVLWISFCQRNQRGHWEFECATSQMALSWAKTILLCINASKIKQVQKQKGLKGTIRQKIFENLGDCPTSKKQDETNLVGFDEKVEQSNNTNFDKEYEPVTWNGEKGNMEQSKQKGQSSSHFEYPNLQWKNPQSDEQIQFEKDTLRAQLQIYKTKCQQYESKVEELTKKMRDTQVSKNKEIEDLKRRIQVLQNGKIRKGNK